MLHTSHQIPVPERIALGLKWIRDPNSCPIYDQGIASSKCFLLYRAGEGLLTPSELEEVRACSTSISNHGLKARWDMSLTIADAYLYLQDRDYDKGIPLIKNVREIWMGGARTEWPPQVLNYIRAIWIELYYEFLTENNNPRILNQKIHEVIQEWKEHIYAWDYIRFPNRTTEAKDDVDHLQHILYLARANGMFDFSNRGGSAPERLPVNKRKPLFNIIREMRWLNPERAIWKEAPPPT